jgi:hypothetical protein
LGAVFFHFAAMGYTIFNQIGTFFPNHAYGYEGVQWWVPLALFTG